MTELIMIRHGQASFHGDDYDILSRMGERQSKILAEYLHKADLFPQAVFCGTMRRHRDTLKAMEEVFLQHSLYLPPAVFMDELREYDHAALINTLIPAMIKDDPSLTDTLSQVRDDPAAFQRFFRQVVARWLSGQYPPKTVESWEEFSGRVLSGIESIRNKAEDVKRLFVITSGGPISIVTGAALGLSPDRTVRLGWEIANASVSRFKLGSSSPVLSVFNAFSFIEEAGSDCVTYR